MTWGILQVNVAHSFLYRFAVEHIFMPVECCRLLKLSHPFSKWTRPSPRTNQKAHQTIAFMNNCKRCAWENTNLSNWHKYMFNWQKVLKGMGYSCLYHSYTNVSIQVWQNCFQIWHRWKTAPMQWIQNEWCKVLRRWSKWTKRFEEKYYYISIV